MKETYRYSFRLKPGRDDDLIGKLENLGDGERSVYIRQALRSAWGGKEAPILPPPKPEPAKEASEPIRWPEFPDSEIKEDETDLNDRLDKLALMF